MNKVGHLRKTPNINRGSSHRPTYIYMCVPTCMQECIQNKTIGGHEKVGVFQGLWAQHTNGSLCTVTWIILRTRDGCVVWEVFQNKIPTENREQGFNG